MKRKRAHSFTVKVQKGYVDVPLAISKAIGVRGRVPIVGEVDGVAPLAGSLNPKGNGRHIIFLNAEHRRLAKVGYGDTVRVTFDVDDAGREVVLPEDVLAALRDEGLLEAFAKVARSKKNWLLKAFDEAVAEPTRARRLGFILAEAHIAREKQADREIQKK
ncbi:MAG: YdeI/OmpD-associated family protein [Polyangiaceae bacterium]